MALNQGMERFSGSTASDRLPRRFRSSDRDEIMGGHSYLQVRSIDQFGLEHLPIRSGKWALFSGPISTTLPVNRPPKTPGTTPSTPLRSSPWTLIRGWKSGLPKSIPMTCGTTPCRDTIQRPDTRTNPSVTRPRWSRSSLMEEKSRRSERGVRTGAFISSGQVMEKFSTIPRSTPVRRWTIPS